METIVIEVPATLKEVVEPIRELIAEIAGQRERALRGGKVEYERFERRVRERTAAVERGAHAVALAALDVDAEQVLIGADLCARVGRYERTYMTQAGPVSVTGSLYRRCGHRNEVTLDPIAIRAGLIEGMWLPGAARAMAHLLQQGSSREAEQTARQIGRLPYSRTSFEHVGHAVGEKYLEQHDQIEEQLVAMFAVPEQAQSVSVSLDRVSVPMEEPRRRPVGRPRNDAPKNPISRVYRQAYVATVTLHDAEGNALHTIRYGTMPPHEAWLLCDSLASDALAFRTQRPDLRIVLLCDGAPELWNLLDIAFDETTFGPVYRLVDFWHVAEKLGAALRVIDATKPDERLRIWKLGLLNRNSAREEILAELRGSGREHARVGDARPVHEAITYLENHAERMRYPRARRVGLPIGSGNVEATCKSLVTVRMKRSGSRWKPRTAEHILHLRALALSDRWDAAMNLTLRVQHVAIRAAG